MAALQHPDLVGLIMAAVDKILHVEKGQVLEAEGIKLHPSEIHLLLFLHARPDANASEIAERFNEYLLVRDGEIVERVKTYRGFGKCFY